MAMAVLKRRSKSLWNLSAPKTVSRLMTDVASAFGTPLSLLVQAVTQQPAPDGTVAARFAPQVEPQDPKVVEAIEAALPS